MGFYHKENANEHREKPNLNITLSQWQINNFAIHFPFFAKLREQENILNSDANRNRAIN